MSTPRAHRLWRALVGAGVGAAALALFVGVVGVGDVSGVLWRVPPRRLRSLVLVGVAPLVIWGLGVRLVFRALGHRLGRPTAVSLFAAATFLNAVTPFGQVGGDPPAGALFARATGTKFETSLAAVGSLNAVNRVAAVVLGLFGAASLGSSVVDASGVGDVAVFAAGAALGLAAVALCWRVRDRAVTLLGSGLAGLARAVARGLPRVDPPGREAVERRAAGFVAALERLASDPRRLAAVFALGLAGHLAAATTLWVALAALGVRTPLTVVVLLVPLAKLGGVAPTPGGTGSVEPLLTALLVAATGASGVDAGAAVLLYRASAFWLPALAGGLATGWAVTVPPGSRARPAGADERPTLSRLVLAAAVGLSVLLVVAVHRRRLLVEPQILLVHLVRDASLAVVTAAVVWGLAGGLPRRWLE
ncbi:MAG: YbhN family protein [Haloferacaceae archaeon]